MYIYIYNQFHLFDYIHQNNNLLENYKTLTIDCNYNFSLLYIVFIFICNKLE